MKFLAGALVVPGCLLVCWDATPHGRYLILAELQLQIDLVDHDVSTLRLILEEVRAVSCVRESGRVFAATDPVYFSWWCGKKSA